MSGRTFTFKFCGVPNSAIFDFTRIKAISELPDPKDIKELRSLLGTFNFVCRFVPEYAEDTAPLVELT